MTLARRRVPLPVTVTARADGRHATATGVLGVVGGLLVHDLSAVMLIGCLLALPADGSAQRAGVLPVDQAIEDPELFVFRARLQETVARRDTAELLRVVAPDILSSFGGDGGREEFREKWSLAQPERSPLWSVLALVLALGGTRHGDTAFYAPYTFKLTPGDGFETLAVLGRNLPVRAGPTTTAAVIDTVGFEAVTRWREARPGPGSAAGWEPIRTSKGRSGWIQGQFVRSPNDYRAGFVRRQGRWWLRALVAGD